MKKILIVLLAIGFFSVSGGLHAQVKKVADKKVAELQKVDQTLIKEALNSSVLNIPGVKAGEVLDTLRFGPEYGNEDCNRYFSMLAWGLDNGWEGWYNQSDWYSAFGNNLSGTGENGVIHHTSGGEYHQYAGLDLNNFNVVGAIAYYQRTGNPSQWASSFPDMVDNTKEGIESVPAIPCLLRAYPEVVDQDVYRLWDSDVEDRNDWRTAPVTYPVDPTNYVETMDTSYMVVCPAVDNQGNAQPDALRIGGMFNKPIFAGNDFAITVKAYLPDSPLRQADTMWGYAIIVKSNETCSLTDPLMAFSVYDAKKAYDNNFYEGNGTDQPYIHIIPWMDDGSDANKESWLPTGNPQLDINPEGGEFFGYAMSYWRGPADAYYAPMIYPIVTEAVGSEKTEAYAKTVSVYPVPATDKATFVSIDYIKDLAIYNMAGALVKKVIVNDNVLELDLNGYTPGTYVAKITTEKGTVSKKMVIR